MKSSRFSIFLRLIFTVVVLTQAPVACAKNDENADQSIEASMGMTNSNQDCNSNRVLRSQIFINFMFEDINSSYLHTGGGGITTIKEVSTDTFEVSIAQEERIDVLTYQLSMNEECKVFLIKKEESTINYGH